MKSNRFSLNWRDAGKAIVLAFLTAFVTALAAALGIEGGSLHFPTGAELWVCVKIGLTAAVAYIIKNYFTNDVPAAQKTLEEARK